MRIVTQKNSLSQRQCAGKSTNNHTDLNKSEVFVIHAAKINKIHTTNPRTKYTNKSQQIHQIHTTNPRNKCKSMQEIHQQIHTTNPPNKQITATNPATNPHNKSTQQINAKSTQEIYTRNQRKKSTQEI